MKKIQIGGLFGLVALVGLGAPLAVQLLQPEPTLTLAVQHQRVLPLEGGQNFRDLGGYRTTDGRTVRWRVLFRSGSMHSLTPADYSYLEKLGIRTVCDFRSTSERKLEPAVWPPENAPRILTADYEIDRSPILRRAGGEVMTAKAARAMMAAAYPQALTQFNEQFRRMFGELLAGRVPLAFNCSAGKDRTGVAAALLLTALGVPRETVIQDYLLTNRYLEPNQLPQPDDQASQQWRRLPPEVLEAFRAADRSYIEAVLKTMESHRGGVMGYLHDQLGLSDIDIQKLRRLYTE
jgi:protein-tyrosine phosphatase